NRILADALNFVRTDTAIAWNDHSLERRNIPSGGNFVFAEVRDFDSAILHRQIFDQTVAEPLNDAAVDLSLMADGVHDHSGIVRRCQSAQCDFSSLGVDGNLCNLGG